MADENASRTNSIQEFSTDLLRLYYGKELFNSLKSLHVSSYILSHVPLAISIHDYTARFFPYQQMFDWLSYGNDPSSTSNVVDKTFFARREWSFTIEDDIYIRYQSFKTQQEFKDAIIKRQPHKIDIGAVFTAPPKDHASFNPEVFKPVERELVFDIDMTDYDDIRTCCKGASICKKCWPYMTMALKVVDKSLRDDFAFKHILWIYSGRRGVHCWVNDPCARELSNEARKAVVEYLSVGTNSKDNSDVKGARSVFTGTLHPSIVRAYDILEPYFMEKICDESGQGLLGDKSACRKLLNSMPDVKDIGKIRKMLDDLWDRDQNLGGAEKWRNISYAITRDTSNNASTAKKVKSESVNNRVQLISLDTSSIELLKQWKYELVFKHCYPRLDANVSIAQNHLLKSPFCVHPKTGRVCVPIDPFYADKFDPFSVPTVRTLCEEVDNYAKSHPNSTGGDQAPKSDIEKTSMGAFIETFEKNLMNDLKKTIRINFTEKERAQKMALKDERDMESAALVDF